MSMPSTQQGRRNRWAQADLFFRETSHSTWDQIPEQSRQEAQRLLARMFMALTGGSDPVPQDEEDDHE